ncbi:MAG TPA: TonB-dependent receptor [Bryobacteraceae bacterium]|jgi:outer membrane receptor protein involved in Fe transport|nr:TonB-dependent receptor [Bryobacteraceae bacterium]
MKLLAASLLFFLSVPAFAQSAGGVAGISGVVRDRSSAAVPDARVVISRESQGTLRTLTTNESGVFTAPALDPGSGYTISVTAKGFAEYTAEHLDLQVGQNLDLNVSLDVGSNVTKVEVTGAAELVNDTKTDLSQVVDTQQIQDLPINGRRVDNFVLLTPGVTNDGNFGLLTFRGIANGNSFLLDGNDSTERFYMENNGRTRVMAQISQDAVQEFQVVSANFSAQFGRADGGVVNTVTRSGNNDLHGGAYWYYRNQNFNAHDPYASINPDDTRHDGGATLGGRFIKDKLFYFVSGEYVHRDFPIADSYIRAGVVDPVNQVWIGCTTPATPAQCSAINALLPRFYGQSPRNFGQYLGFGRLDYHLSDRNSFTASFNYMQFQSPNGLQQTTLTSTTGAAINGNGNDYSRVRNAKVGWTSIPTSSLVNELRYGWDTDLEGDDPNPALLGKALGLLDVSVNGVQLGPINYLPRVEPRESRHEVADNLTWTKEKHTIQAGVDVTTSFDHALFLQNPNGSYTYQTATQFAQDYTGNTTGAKNWQRFTQTLGTGTTDMRINNYGFYLQDVWRVTPKLTVTLGARYEYEPVPQPKLCNQDYPDTCHINSQTTNFMPRVGVAYRLDGKTVLRAGYGLFYASVPGATLMNLWLGNGLTQQSISLSNTQPAQLAAGPAFPGNLSSLPAGYQLGTANIQFAAPNFKRPYSEQGTFAVERQLTRDTVLTASYIWSRGIQLYSERDLNLPPLSPLTYTYTIDDANGNNVGSYTTPIYLKLPTANGRPDPRYGSVVQAENGVTSFYNGLAIQAVKRFSHGLSGSLSYTWSHEIDDGQGYGQATQNIFLSNAFSWLFNGNYKLDKGNGEEDQRHRFALAWVWQPTFSHRSGAFYKYVVNNWQLSSVTTINSARPYGSATVNVLDTPIVTGTLGPGVPGMFSNFSLNGSGGSGRVPFWPVDSVNQPALYKEDARISKILPFGAEDRYKVLVSFEAFNISNSWSPTSMTTQAYTEAKGVLTLTPAAYGFGTSDSFAPDGTLARRMQVSVRFQF